MICFFYWDILDTPFKLVYIRAECILPKSNKGCVADVQSCYHACKVESDMFIYARSDDVEKCSLRGRSCQCQRSDSNGHCDQGANPDYDLYTSISKLFLYISEIPSFPCWCHRKKALQKISTSHCLFLNM